MMFSLLAILLLMLCNFQTGLAFKCFNCTDSIDEHCGNTFDPTGLSAIECPNGVCVTFTGLKIDFKKLIHLQPQDLIDPSDTDAIKKLLEEVSDAIMPELGVYRTCEHNNFCETYKKLDLLNQFKCLHCEGELCNSFL